MMCTPENKLNRSFSESDLYKVKYDNLTIQDYSLVGFDKKFPVVRKRIVFVEEIIHGSSPGLLRSDSCPQVFGPSTPDQLHNLQSFFSTRLVLNNSLSDCDISGLSLNTQINPNVPKVRTNCMENEGVTPMDIDVLHNSFKIDNDFVEEMDMDIDTDDFTSRKFNNLEHTDSELKKRNSSQKQAEEHYSRQFLGVANKTKIVPIMLQTKKSQRNNFILILLVSVILILLYLSFIQANINIMSVNSDIQLQNIQKDLLANIHKQKDSVNVIVRSLEKRDHWPKKIKVLGFIGPTGVGKTFVTNIIKKHFHQGLIHELYGIQLNYKSEWDKILATLQNCCFNLIIIDDLKRSDTTELFALVHSLLHNQFILVISIFNVQYYDGKNYNINFNDVSEIRNEFDDSGLYHELVIFKEFSTDEVKDWIEKQLKFKNISNNLQEKVLKNVLEGHMIKYQGLKGLHSKILLELEKYNH